MLRRKRQLTIRRGWRLRSRPTVSFLAFPLVHLLDDSRVLITARLQQSLAEDYQLYQRSQTNSPASKFAFIAILDHALQGPAVDSSNTALAHALIDLLRATTCLFPTRPQRVHFRRRAWGRIRQSPVCWPRLTVRVFSFDTVVSQNLISGLSFDGRMVL